MRFRHARLEYFAALFAREHEQPIRVVAFGAFVVIAEPLTCGVAHKHAEFTREHIDAHYPVARIELLHDACAKHAGLCKVVCALPFLGAVEARERHELLCQIDRRAADGRCMGRISSLGCVVIEARVNHIPHHFFVIDGLIPGEGVRRVYDGVCFVRRFAVFVHGGFCCEFV